MLHLYRSGQLYCWRKLVRTGEEHRPVEVSDKMYHIMWYRVHLVRAGFELTTFTVICTNFTGSGKSIYHATRPMMHTIEAINVGIQIMREGMYAPHECKQTVES